MVNLKKLIPSSSGKFVNTGSGPKLAHVDIGHPEYLAVVDPDTAFWFLAKRRNLPDLICNGRVIDDYRRKAKGFLGEINTLRFNLKPSAVYFNLTERCNLNCDYCYIPERMRRSGEDMPLKQAIRSLRLLKSYFKATLPKGVRPKIIFHGAEPLLSKDLIITVIKEFGKDFNFGIQTNATLLDKDTIKFFTSRNISIGISLDGATAKIADKTRSSWSKEGSYRRVSKAIKDLKGYDSWSVICTITDKNFHGLNELVDFFHQHKVPTCLLNILRCTMPKSRSIKPDDLPAAKYFIAALERTYQLYKKTGRKLVVANFANILISILAPTARRLMCDISPCGGGRSFFALSPNGDVFPCSEFIGLSTFAGGNLFQDKIKDILKSKQFSLVTGRRVEDIEPCRRCAIRHFCGSPCPAEAYEMNGGMSQRGAFCEFYEEQVRFAFRVIADKKQDAFLWDDWAKDTRKVFDLG